MSSCLLLRFQVLENWQEKLIKASLNYFPPYLEYASPHHVFREKRNPSKASYKIMHFFVFFDNWMKTKFSALSTKGLEM